MKNNNYDLNELNNKEIFELALIGDIKKLPNDFWTKETIIEATKWVIEEKLQWDDEDIKNKLTLNILRKYGINIYYLYEYFNNIYDLINEIYSNRFKPWELKNASLDEFWTKETIIEATKWMIEEKLQWTEEDIKNNLIIDILRKYGINVYYFYKYYDSLYDLVNDVYPNKFKSWELRNVSSNFWTKETIIEATKWMIEEKLQWTEEDIKNKLTLNVLKKYKINSCYFYKYFNSIYDLVNEIYPNRFKPWEMKNVPNNFWTKELFLEATKWMIEEKLQWDDEDIKNNLSLNTFKEYGLYSMIVKKYKNNVYNAINEVYPGRFHRDDFDRRLKKNRINKG